VSGVALQRDWFRRSMEPHLAAAGRFVTVGRGRPAEIFRRSRPR
jgi:8-oxo-dGTP diphosphatase